MKVCEDLLQDLDLQHPDPHELNDHRDQDLIEGIGRLNTMVSALQRSLLAFVSEYDRRRLWQRDGCRHMGHWLAGHLGVTVSEGLRWTDAVHALEELEETAASRSSAASLPRVPESTFEQRCADALVALASAGIEIVEDRPTVVLSADLRALGSDQPGCEIEAGPVLHPEVARRISCDCRLQAILRDPGGRAVGIGRRSRNVPGWLMRELLARDGGCTFPGCGTGRFLAAHHVVHWAHGGATQLDNLALLCSFHHKLVHEGGWKVKLQDGLEAVWLRPNGVRYDPAPSLVKVTNVGPRLELLDSP